MSKHMCKAPNSDINQPHPTHETTPNNMQVLAAECALPWPGSRLKRMSEIAFDSDRKRMSVVWKALPPTAADGSALPTPKSGEAGFAAGPADLNKRWVVFYVRWSIGGLVDQRQVNQTPMHMEQTNNHRAGGESKARVVLSKGAPEVLLGLCSQWMGADGKARKMDGAKLKEVDQWCDAFSEQVGGGVLVRCGLCFCWCAMVGCPWYFEVGRRGYAHTQTTNHKLQQITQQTNTGPPHAGAGGALRRLGQARGQGTRCVLGG